MAFVQDDEELDPNAPPSTGGDSGVISGTGGSSSTKAPTSPNAPGGMPGNFVGIQQYLDANKPQSEKLAGQVGSYVTDLGDTARKTTSEQKGLFDKAVSDNTVNFNQDLYNQAQNNAEQVDSDAAKKAEFQKMYGAQYKGPESFTGSTYDIASSNANKAAIDAANQTKNEEGQRQLVSGLQKKTAGYTGTGAQAFDSALLQAAPSARGILSDASSKQSDLKANLDAIKAEEDKNASTASSDTNTTGQRFQSTFGNQNIQKQIEDALTKRAGTQNQASKDSTKAIIQKLQNGEALTDAEIAQSGLGGNASVSPYSSIQDYKNYVPDLSQYFSTVEPNITGQQVANPEEYARYAALNDLTGQNANYLTNPALAGTAPANAPASFDLGKFMTDAIAGRTAQNAKPARPPQETRESKLQKENTQRVDNATKAGILTPESIPIGYVTPEIQKAGGNIAKAFKKITSDKNAKTNISKFDPSEFLDSLTRKKHG